MKQIIIFLLLIILGVIGYNQYKQYKRFSLEKFEYKISKTIDLDYYNKSVVYNYYEAIEDINSYVALQWCANDIDVRNPKDDDEETQAAVAAYAKKMAKAKYYEAQLERASVLKAEGFNNEEIKFIQNKGISLKEQQEKEQKAYQNKLIWSMFNPAQGQIKLGEKSALVHQIQKLLVKKGYDIPIDGVYKNITFHAIKDFEAKNNLFPDGQLDALTLEALLH